MDMEKLMDMKELLDRMCLYEKDQYRLNEWEKSLPHDEFYFPGVPRFTLTMLQQKLGLETAAPPSSSSSSSSFSAPFTILKSGCLNYPFEHDLVCRRNDCMMEEGGLEDCSSIVEGEKFDLEDCLVDDDDDEGRYLVRKDGTTLVQVDSLRNKHVLLCCFYVPLYWGFCGTSYARSISSMCEELELANSKGGVECEMVIVAKMTPWWADNEAAFHHFFEAFPPSCLTIPFHHKKRVNRICRSLDLRSFFPPTLFIGPDRKVLCTHLYQFWNYGVKDGYPFSNERLRAVEEDDKRLLTGSCSRPLATLLGGWRDPLPPDHRLRDVVTGEERISVSELEQREVGLYLCCRGDLLDRLTEVYHHCKKKKKECGDFEIVVVWFPDETGLGKSEFEQLMTAAFESRGLSFLVLPFDNSLARRLIRISGDHRPVPLVSDRLLTVGARGAFVDPVADLIIERWEVDYAYPFSLAALLDRELERLRSVELDSILGKIKSVVHVKENNQSPITREELKAIFKGKQVLIFHTVIGEPRVLCHCRCSGKGDPWSWSEEITSMYPDCEVLYVQSCKMDYDSRDFPNSLSFYMCPFDASLSEYLNTITTVAHSLPSHFLVFGKDGRIPSLSIGPCDPCAETLRDDICIHLVSCFADNETNNSHARLSRVGGLILGTTRHLELS